MSSGLVRTAVVLVLCSVTTGCVVPGDDAAGPAVGAPGTPRPEPTTEQLTADPSAADDGPSDGAEGGFVDPAPPGSAVLASVDRVVDGDTVVVDVDGALLPEDEPVLLATDVEERDQYGRLLAHVWTRATWVNAQMLRDGYAQVVTFPPNTSYDEEVLTAQQQARDAAVGLWDPARCP